MKNNNTDNDVKSYKWVKLKNDPPKNSVLYVLDPETGDVELFITDKNGNPKPVKTEASVNIGDYVKTNSNNIIKVEQNKIFVKKTIAGDSFINIEETNNNYILTLNQGTIEFITNKQNNLTPDGTGTKYPTVDAVNEVVGVINERIDDIELTPGADGKSAYELAVEEGFIGTLDEWLDSLQGDDGIDGKSAYQIWLDEGNTGTVEDFLESLVGKDGDKGDAFTYDDFTDSQLEALKGEDGVDGKSAYELWLDQGNTGTIQDFLTSLEGDDGLSAYEIALINGFVGTEVQWLQSLIGQQGLSAYQIWLQQGNVGSVQDFLDSLIGEDGYTPIKNIDYFDGANGDSAYQIWLDLGNVGTPQDFINSLQGDDGQAGSVVTIGTNDNWFIDNVDTGVKAVGEDGLDGYTPIKGIDYFDGTDGYTPQKGIDYFDGTNGTDGKDGNGWFGGSSNPASSLGQIGDWYVNNTTWDVFEKTTSGVWTLRGNIKGGDGADGISGIISLVTASIGNSTGIPSVVVTLGGTPTNRTINLDFNNLKGDKGDKGEDGKGVRIVGTLLNPGLLPTPPLKDDDAYLIDGDLWVWDSINNTWVNVGNIQGPAGLPNILTIGTVTTGTPGSTASASITGTSPSQILNLVIPEGLPGSNAPTYTGSNGINVTSTVISPIYGNIVGTIAEGNDPRFHNAVTIGLANGLSLNNQILSLALANGTTTGALSSTDWNNFNNKTSANNGNISYTGTGSIIGGGVSSANQSGNTAYTFDLSTQTKSDINLGVIANGWGNHALMGYLTSANLVGYATQTWVSTNFAQLVHTHTTGHITSLTGYTIGTNTPLVASDTLNQALGKLQSQLDNKGTVTSITAGTGLSGGTITTSGTIALNASTIASLNLANSALQSGDNISELINDVGYLTLPVLAGYVPVSRTLTINGVTYDLTSNRSWNIPIANDGNITYTGTGSITGGGTSTANQSGNTNYSFDLTAQTKTDIGLGVTANSWGNHANMGYLTSFTETDPIFTASVAYGITSSDITNWNNKTSNLGTVTSITAGTGLSGGTINISGTIALNSATLASLALADTALQVESDPIFTASPAYGITSGNITSWNAKQSALTNGSHTTLLSNQVNVEFEVNTPVIDKSGNTRLIFGNTSSTDVVIHGAVANGDFKVKDSTGADMFRIIGSSKVPQFPQLPSAQTMDGNIAIFDTGDGLWKHSTRISDLVTQAYLTTQLNLKANTVGNNLSNIPQWLTNLGVYSTTHVDGFLAGKADISWVQNNYTLTNGSNLVNVPSWKANLGFLDSSDVPIILGGYFKHEYTGSINNGSDPRTNQSWFDYNYASTSNAGVVASFDGLGPDYRLEIFGNYTSGEIFYVRTRNGDTGTWNPARYLWHNGNFDPSTKADVSFVNNNFAIRDGSNLINIQNWRDNLSIYSIAETNILLSQKANTSGYYSGLHVGNSDGWNGAVLDASTFGTSIGFMLGYDTPSGKYMPFNSSQLNSFLGINIASYALIDGSNVTPNSNWNINANNAVNWGGLPYIDINNTNPVYFITGQGNGQWNYSDISTIASALQLGNYVNKAGDTMSGALHVPRLGFPSYSNPQSRNWNFQQSINVVGDFALWSTDYQGNNPRYNDIYITPSGDVGFGTLNPQAKLHVNGNAIVADATAPNHAVAFGQLANYALLSQVPTNNNQLTNGAGYITSANLSGYALISQIPTNNNQLTNGAGYITAASLPTVNNGSLIMSVGAGLTGSAIFTANQAGTSNFDIGIAAGFTLPTTTQVGNWNNAFSWGNHAGLYPLLSGSYNNPTWITGLDWSKITNKPSIPNAPNNGTFTVTGINSLTGSGSTSADASSNSAANIDLTTTTKNDIKQGTEAKAQITDLFDTVNAYYKYNDMSAGGTVDVAEAFFNLVNPRTVSGLTITINDHFANGARLVLQAVYGVGGIVTYNGNFIDRDHNTSSFITIEGDINKEYVWDSNTACWREVFK